MQTEESAHFEDEEFRTYVPQSIVSQAIENIIRRSQIQSIFDQEDVILMPILNGGLFLFQKILSHLESKQQTLKILPLRISSYKDGNRGKARCYIASMDDFNRALDDYAYKPPYQFEAAIPIEKEALIDQTIIDTIHNLEQRKIVVEDMIDSGQTLLEIQRIIGVNPFVLYLFQKQNHNPVALEKMNQLFFGLTIENVWVAGCGADGGSSKVNYRIIEDILVKKQMYDENLQWQLA